MVLLLSCFCDFAFKISFFFLMWTIFKDFIEFVTMFLLFYILLPVAVWHAPCPGIEPSPPALAVQPPDC